MIPIEETVCILDQSKRLVELGVVLESEKYWITYFDREPELKEIHYIKPIPAKTMTGYYPAPSCAELGVLLPSYLILENPLDGPNMNYNLLIWKVTNKAFNVDYFTEIHSILMNRWASENLASVMADRLICLIENNNIKPSDLKL